MISAYVQNVCVFLVNICKAAAFIYFCVCDYLRLLFILRFYLLMQYITFYLYHFLEYYLTKKQYAFIEIIVLIVNCYLWAFGSVTGSESRLHYFVPCWPRFV